MKKVSRKSLVRVERPLLTLKMKEPHLLRCKTLLKSLLTIPPPKALMLTLSTNPFGCMSKGRPAVSVIQTLRPSKPLSASTGTI
uniref:Uncharacterized protein n=1 Tax=Lepeophtheirus salmonis TaxID=72036 RepID=A0A0K2TK38_LEPSM